MRRRAALAVLALGLGACGTSARAGSGAAASPAGSSASQTAGVPDGDWPTFDFNAARTGVGPVATGITRTGVARLRTRVVELPGTVDSAPIQLHDLLVAGRRRDVVFLTTTYGRTIALDPAGGRPLWAFAPRAAVRLEGSAQITTAGPVADPSRRYVYATTPNGYVHKLVAGSGRDVRAGGWPARVTFDPTREKLASALTISGRSLIVVTDGYFGDAPTYQGHVVTIDRASGRLTHVWNSLCSDIHGLIDPPSRCPVSDAAIWGRAGAVVEPSGRILVSTGNGPFNGRTNWGDSVLELSPALRLLHNWTPGNQSRLEASDTDLGSTSPVVLPVWGGRRLAVQGGKAGIFTLLDLDRLNGTRGGAGARTGGELQDIATPGGGEVLTAPAVWSHGGRILLFAADDQGTSAYGLVGRARPRLRLLWSDGTAGTSPVLAGGLLYVYDPGGALLVRDPLNGAQLARYPAPGGHWNSPIVVGGRVILPTGNANSHATSGQVLILHRPGR